MLDELSPWLEYIYAVLNWAIIINNILWKSSKKQRNKEDILEQKYSKTICFSINIEMWNDKQQLQLNLIKYYIVIDNQK